MRRLLLLSLLLLCTAPAAAQLSNKMVKKTTTVDINTTVENQQQRSYSKLLLLGTGSYFSRNTWQHLCMQLQERLKDYKISATYQYLSSDAGEAKQQYAQILKEHNFDAILWFACDGRVKLNEVIRMPSYTDMYGNAYGGGTYNHSATNADSSVEMSGYRGSSLVAEQQWILTLYTPDPNEILWAANMLTRVVEMNEKSYKKVTDALLRQLEENQVLTAITPSKK